MSPEVVRRYLEVKPFVPFAFRMPDGRALRVASPEFLNLPEQGRHLIVEQPDGTKHVVDLLIVSDLEIFPPPGGLVMTTDDARALWHREPFQPFILQMADGQSIFVPRRQSFSINPRGHVSVMRTETDFDVFVRLDAVANVQILPVTAGPNGNAHARP
jgi:hypothetical protein